jgi:thymidine kinase
MFAAVLTASLVSYSKALIELGQSCLACRVEKYMTWRLVHQGSMRFTIQEHMKHWLCGLK